MACRQHVIPNDNDHCVEDKEAITKTIRQNLNACESI